MKSIFNKRSVLILGTSLAGIGYIFSIKLASIGMILFLVSWLINYRGLSFKKIFSNYYQYPFYFFFLFLALSLTYSINIAKGIDFLVRNIAYIIYPVVFSSIYFFTKKESSRILRIYCYSVAGVILFCLCIAIYRQWNVVGSFEEINWYFFYGFDFFEAINQHPTYVSMYSVLSIGVLFFDKEKIFVRTETSVLLTLLIFGVLFSGSRIGYITFIIISAIYFINKVRLNRKKLRIKSIIIPLLIAAIVLISFMKIPIIKERIFASFGIKDFKYSFFHNKEAVTKGNPVANGRLVLWSDAIEVIKEKPFLGYGVGSNKAVLLEKYKEKGHVPFFKARFNVHNTYLEILIIGGIPLLLSYLMMLIFLLYKAFRNRNLILVSFFIVIALTSLTETLFRVQGILFFTFFYCFFLHAKRDE